MNTSAPPRVASILDDRGRAVSLGKPIGRGGEGVVYEIDGSADVVAKLYHQPPAGAQAAKLRAMAGLPSEELRRVSAWPVATLHPRTGGEIVGVVLPRVVGHRPIHHLYGPRSRLSEFPRADWRFLVHVAANLARAFAVVHAHGQVVGDVNQGNVLVAANGTVRFIDCDSFQVEIAGRRFACEVGVAPYQPPEFQRLPTFRGVIRTPSHDGFGLAVLIFQLLMLGRHPFAGAYTGAGEMPVERAIAEGRFVYGRGMASRGMRPPPCAPPIEVVSAPVAALFERAFDAASARSGRPDAPTWARALDQLRAELAFCPRNLGHGYYRRLATCPWCELESRARTALFAPRYLSQPAAPALDLAAVWAEIEAVPSPGPAPALPAGRARKRPPPSPRARRLARLGRALHGAAILIAVVGGLAGAIGTAVSGPRDLPILAGSELVAWAIWRLRTRPRGSLIGARLRAREDCRRLAARWAREAGEPAFLAKRAELEVARRAYLDLPSSQQRLMEELVERRRERQRQRFLDRHPMAGARIPGIGPGREVMLASYGVETAADVTDEALQAIAGLGASLKKDLLAWRQQLERGFAYDPRQAIDPGDLSAVEQELAATRTQLSDVLRRGAADLRAIADQTERARRVLRADLDRAVLALAQADADLSVEG